MAVTVAMETGGGREGGRPGGWGGARQRERNGMRKKERREIERDRKTGEGGIMYRQARPAMSTPVVPYRRGHPDCNEFNP